jgi:hypothetical protein
MGRNRRSFDSSAGAVPSLSYIPFDPQVMSEPARDSEKRSQTPRHAPALTEAATDSERQQQESVGNIAHLLMVKVVMYLQASVN